MKYRRTEQRNKIQLSNEDFERIAKRANELAKEDYYTEVGKTVIREALLWSGRILFGLFVLASIWLTSKGYFK